MLNDHIDGENVRLRLFQASDITPTYLSWLNDPDVTRYSNQRFKSHDNASCAAYLASFAGTPNLFVSILRLSDAVPIGTMTCYLAPHHGTADLGILVGAKDVWGKGYGQDAWNTLSDWLFSVRGLRKLTAGTLAPNVGMVRLMERSGMVHEATRAGQEIWDGRPVDVVYYARFSG